MSWFTRLLLILLVAGGMQQRSATAQEFKPPDREAPVWFKADDVRSDDELGLIVATGNVEFSQSGRTVLADSVTYNHRSNTVTASGNVSLLEVTGEVLYADYMVLTGDLREGAIRNLGLRLSNDARMAAAGARRIDGRYTVLRKSVYSACEVCENNPARPPAWQVKGSQAVHDQQAKEIIYRDAFLEIFGVPVMYVPYLSHPDPTLERRSGVLAPHYASYEDLGHMVRIPLYNSIAPNRDLTLVPTVTTKAGIGAEFRFRHLLENGEYDIWTSLFDEEVSEFVATHLGIDRYRGHVKADLRYDIDRHWRASGNIFLSTDDTFLRKYGFSEETTLDNHLALERFEGRNYLYLGARHYQGLQFDHDDGLSPIVFPILDYSHVFDADAVGGTWTINSNFARLTRTDGRDTTRASLSTAWRRPFATQGGHLFQLRGRVQSDFYHTSDLLEAHPNASDASTDDESTTRIFPQAALEWRYPLVVTGNGITRIVEPQAAIVLAPKAPDNTNIPNEDSLSVEFDDTNVLAMNRYTGFDRVEGYSRISYGVRGSLFDEGELKSSLYLGQSHRIYGESDFGADTGLDTRFSDIVGRVRLSYKDWLDLVYRFRFDHGDMEMKRNELHMKAGAPILNLDLNYLSIEPRFIEGATIEQARLGEREELKAQLTSQISEHWQVGLDMHRILAYGGHSILHGIFFVYDDECLQVRLNYSRSFASDREIQPRDWLFLTVDLKTLAGGTLLGLSR